MEERVVTANIRPTLSQWISVPRWLGMVAQDVRAVHRARYVLRNLIVTQLKIRYHRSALGFFWTLLNPVLMLGVQALVFSYIVKTSGYPYAVYLFAGFVPWQFVATAIDNGSRSLLSSEGLIRKIAAPKLVFPLADVVVCLINMVFAMAALSFLFLFIWPHVYIQVVLIPVGTVFLCAFTLGLVLISMSLTTFFRDFLHLIPILLQAWYFASPILYPREALGADNHFARLLGYNPLTYFLAFFQHAIVFGTWPDARTWIIAPSVALAVLVAGYMTYKRLEHDYIFRL